MWVGFTKVVGRLTTAIGGNVFRKKVGGSVIQGKLENLITVIMNQQLKLGPTTRFYHTHRKFLTSTRELYDNHRYEDDYLSFQDDGKETKTPLMECIECEMKKLKPYEQMIIRKNIMYGHKFKEIAEEYGIPSSTIARDVKRELKKLNELCKKYS